MLRLLLAFLLIFTASLAAAETPLEQFTKQRYKCEQTSPFFKALWTRSVAYQIFVDRFFDGDKENNHLVLAGYKHGDFEGVIQKLGYLKQLRVNLLL